MFDTQRDLLGSRQKAPSFAATRMIVIMNCFWWGGRGENKKFQDLGRRGHIKGLFYNITIDLPIYVMSHDSKRKHLIRICRKKYNFSLRDQFSYNDWRHKCAMWGFISHLARYGLHQNTFLCWSCDQVMKIEERTMFSYQFRGNCYCVRFFVYWNVPRWLIRLTVDHVICYRCRTSSATTMGLQHIFLRGKTDPIKPPSGQLSDR